LNFSIQGIIVSLQGMWQKLTQRQKIITLTTPLLVLVLLLSLVWWAGRPDFTPLFQSQLQTSEAGAVVNKLKELKVQYQLTDGGTTILVPKAKVAELRIQLASAGLPNGSKFSFSNLNEIRFGETDADRKIRYTLGLQDELETTLKTLSPIEAARVHLALPEQSLFIEKEKEPTAAVTVKLQPGGKLSEEQIRGIANLLASSIEGLKPEKVTIVDTTGQLLSESLNQKDSGKLSVSQLQLQQTIEQNLQKAAQSMLDKIFGPGKSVVRVAGNLDFDQVEIKRETYGDSVLRSKQSKEEVSTSNSGTSGIPGTNSNVPGYQSVTVSDFLFSAPPPVTVTLW